MAFAPPNPRKVKFERDQEAKQFQAQRAAAIQAENEKRVATKQQREEIRACYRKHCPPQIAHAGAMIGGQRFQELLANGSVAFKRIGRSNGGKTKGNLYHCRLVSKAVA